MRRVRAGPPMLALCYAMETPMAVQYDPESADRHLASGAGFGEPHNTIRSFPVIMMAENWFFDDATH